MRSPKGSAIKPCGTTLRCWTRNCSGKSTRASPLPGWRKFKACERAASQVVYRGGPHKEKRVKAAVREYLAVGRDLSVKVRQTLLGLCGQAVDLARWERLEYFHRMLDKHLDLVERRLLKEEAIPAVLETTMTVQKRFAHSAAGQTTRAAPLPGKG
jgi:hypothetical protein